MNREKEVEIEEFLKTFCDGKSILIFLFNLDVYFL